MKIEIESLPQNWEIVAIEQIANTSSGGTPKRTEESYFKGNIPWVKSGELRDGKITSIAESITEEGLKNSSAKIFPKGTLCIAMYGATVGKVGILSCDAATNQAVCAIFLPHSIETKYLFYSLKNLKTKLIAISKGGAQPNISQSVVQNTEILLAPTKEQKRIVDKIEALQAKSNKAKKALETAKPLLDKLRQSILAAAFRGDLTADWRKKNPDVEPASILLERIREERRKRWEETELAKMKAKGKKPKNDKWKAKYKEPEPVDATGLPELPEGWCWANIDELSSLVQYGSSTKTNEDTSSIPVLRMGNIVNGKLSYDNLRYLPEDNKDFPNLLLADGDLLFNRTNSPELVGKSAIFEDIEKPCSFASYLIRVRIILMKSSMAAGYINSPFGRKWIDSVVNQQVGQANVNGTKLKALSIPIPPLEEQKVLENKINESLSHSESTLQKIESTITMIEKQNQSMLAKAFRGELVPQDPTDEPASVLLDRIKAEREAMKPKKKTTRKRKTPAA
ncbi:MAG: restriction endonuclease subunit S [Desulfobacteraceae bacterium]|nr:restriction endonuclease subunit S [Desulfobacteraceae bacterium]